MILEQLRGSAIPHTDAVAYRKCLSSRDVTGQRLGHCHAGPKMMPDKPYVHRLSQLAI